MSARRAFFQAALLAAVAVTPTYAQDPPDPAAPPPRAVERANRRARPDDSAERAPRGADRQQAPEIRQRERVAVTPSEPSAAPSAPSPALEEQGGRRRPSGSGRSGGGRVSGGSRRDGGDAGARPRGGVRNPDVDGGRDVQAQAVPRNRAPRPPVSSWAPSYGRRYYGGPSGFGYYYYDPWSWYGGGPAYGAWGWGGYYGSGYGNYGGYGGYGSYGSYGTYGGPYGWSIGGVRLKVDDRDAEVYVDGYYAGTVDDFDGVWQQLRLDDGGYRIEIRKPGYETLVFDVRILPGRTITYRGHLARLP